MTVRKRRATTVCAAVMLGTMGFLCNSCSHPNAAEVANAEPSAPSVPSTPVEEAANVSRSTSVKVSIELIVEKKYGMLAHAFGHEDETVRRDLYDADAPWWKNPLVVFSDPVMATPDVAAQARATPLAGKGSSSNVEVGLTLIPHAEVAYKGLEKCDGVKGTITIHIDTMNDYFDSAWTPMLRLKNQPITFAFDTCRPGEAVEQVTQEKRSMPVFAFERYTRDHERWDKRSEWPKEAASGDFRTTIVGRDAVLEITGYRYKGMATAR